ncbi:MAG: cell division protein ZapA [Bacteroidales bacterium]|jgi:cell division protein ZapA|nr:cell division protein ZapA [Bacteroidales bacterium]
MEELTITVNIAERPYRLKIKREEEEVIRKAVKEIEQRIREYSEHFAFNDKQDLMAMVLLHYASTAHKLEGDILSAENLVISQLRKMEELITHHLD